MVSSTPPWMVLIATQAATGGEQYTTLDGMWCVCARVVQLYGQRNANVVD